MSDPAPFFIWNPPQLINLLDFVWQIFQRLLKRIALNKEPQKQRVNEMEQEQQEDDYINAFDFLNNFWCCHCWDLLLETFYFVLYKTFFKKKTLWPLFLWMGFNCLKATATSGRQFTFYHSVPRRMSQPRTDERLSRPWSQPVVLSTGPLDWESSAYEDCMKSHTGASLP